MQPVPNVSEDDVKRIVRRDFAVEGFIDVMAILSEYGTEPGQPESHRVRLAILKLANGDKNQLRAQVEIAKCDYRDVLAYAEYPAFIEKGLPGGERSLRSTQTIIDRAWAQYQEWLNRR